METKIWKMASTSQTCPIAPRVYFSFSARVSLKRKNNTRRIWIQWMVSSEQWIRCQKGKNIYLTSFICTGHGNAAPHIHHPIECYWISSSSSPSSPFARLWQFRVYLHSRKIVAIECAVKMCGCRELLPFHFSPMEKWEWALPCELPLSCNIRRTFLHLHRKILIWLSSICPLFFANHFSFFHIYRFGERKTNRK